MTRKRWIKLWTQETLYGTTSRELELPEQAIWFKLLALAGDSIEPGNICAAPGIPWKDDQIAQILRVPEMTWLAAKEKMLLHQKIENHGGTLEIVNWEKYQGQFDRAEYMKTYMQERRKTKGLTEQAEEEACKTQSLTEPPEPLAEGAISNSLGLTRQERSDEIEPTVPAVTPDPYLVKLTSKTNGKTVNGKTVTGKTGEQNRGEGRGGEQSIITSSLVSKEEALLTPATTYLFAKTSRKRWSNLFQKEEFESCEREVGLERMREAIDWALLSGIVNVKSILTAARRGKPNDNDQRGQRKAAARRAEVRQPSDFSSNEW